MALKWNWGVIADKTVLCIVRFCLMGPKLISVAHHTYVISLVRGKNFEKAWNKIVALI